MNCEICGDVAKKCIGKKIICDGCEGFSSEKSALIRISLCGKTEKLWVSEDKAKKIMESASASGTGNNNRRKNSKSNGKGKILQHPKNRAN